jgi:hypothetical protein
MYNKEDRAVANDQYRAVMNQLYKMDRDEECESAYIASIGKYRKKITDLRLKMTELQTKVDLYEKYISYCIDHDSVELGEVCSFNGELYLMVSREDKQDTNSAKTVSCEFRCTTPLTKDFSNFDDRIERVDPTKIQFIDETHNYLHAQKEYLGSFKKSK